MKNNSRAPYILYSFLIPSIYGKLDPVYRQDESRPRRVESLPQTGIQILFLIDILITKSTNNYVVVVFLTSRPENFFFYPG